MAERCYNHHITCHEFYILNLSNMLLITPFGKKRRFYQMSTQLVYTALQYKHIFIILWPFFTWIIFIQPQKPQESKQ